LKIKVIEQKFSGEFHKKDNQKFFPINLNIPEGTQKLKLKFTYFPEYMKNKKQAVEDINNKLNDFYKKNVIKLDSEMQFFIIQSIGKIQGTVGFTTFLWKKNCN
jgi:hypothetical protein